MAGPWLLAPEGGGPGCRVTLGTAAVIGGFEIEPARDCQATLPTIADAAAWRFSEGGLVIADATRRTLVTFSEQEDGTYVSTAEPDRRLLLTKGPEGVTGAPEAEAILGPWAMVRPEGERLCMISLVEADSALVIPGSCDGSVQRLKLSSWGIEGVELVLYGADGASLTFEPDGAGGFRKAAREGGKSLLLVRPRK